MNKVLVLSASVLVSGFLLQGCEKIVYSETELSQSKMQLQEEAIFEEVRVDKMDASYVAALARHYSSQGNGAVEMTVTYDPQSKTNTAMHASNHAARIAEEFRNNGVQVNSSILPIKGQGDDANVIVSYDSYTLSAPEDCDVMPGFEDRNVEPTYDYKLGCTRDTVLAKQIARPKDLMGGAGEQNTSDGRRAANIVERYRTGEPNDPLVGETASE